MWPMSIFLASFSRNRIFRVNFFWGKKTVCIQRIYETYVMEKPNVNVFAVEQRKKKTLFNKNLRGCEEAFKHEERTQAELMGF